MSTNLESLRQAELTRLESSIQIQCSPMLHVAAWADDGSEATRLAYPATMGEAEAVRVLIIAERMEKFDSIMFRVSDEWHGITPATSVLYHRDEAGVVSRLHRRAVSHADTGRFRHREQLLGWPESAVWWAKETGASTGIAKRDE